MNGEDNRIPIYNPVACNPFMDEEIPFCSRMTAISGSSIPCEKPEIVTSPIKIQKRDFEDTIMPLPFMLYVDFIIVNNRKERGKSFVVKVISLGKTVII